MREEGRDKVQLKYAVINADEFWSDLYYSDILDDAAMHHFGYIKDQQAHDTVMKEVISQGIEIKFQEGVKDGKPFGITKFRKSSTPGFTKETAYCKYCGLQMDFSENVGILKQELEDVENESGLTRKRWVHSCYHIKCFTKKKGSFSKLLKLKGKDFELNHISVIRVTLKRFENGQIHINVKMRYPKEKRYFEFEDNIRYLYFYINRQRFDESLDISIKRARAKDKINLLNSKKFRDIVYDELKKNLDIATFIRTHGC